MSEEKKSNETKRDKFVRLAEKELRRQYMQLKTLVRYQTQEIMITDVDVKKLKGSESLNQVKAAFKTKERNGI